MPKFNFRNIFRKPGLYDGLKPYVVDWADGWEEAEVNLYGTVVSEHPIDWWTGEKASGLFIALDDFLADLDHLKGLKSVRFNINSTGGDVDAGIAIYNKIRDLSSGGVNVVTRVEGAADSAASLIAQAGDRREVAVGSEIMIHCASGLLIGYYDSKELDGMKDMLDAADKRIAELLADTTGKSVQEVKRLMQKTTWMTAEQSVSDGFADEVVNKRVQVEAVPGVQNMLVINGIPHGFHGLPLPFGYGTPDRSQDAAGNKGGTSADPEGDAETVAENAAEGKTADPVVEKQPLFIDQTNQKGGTKMTRQELEAAYPEIVAEIRNEAATEAKAGLDGAIESEVKAERDRIMAIEEIENTVADKKLVHSAKYESPMDASALALNALKAQSALAARREQARDEELQESGVYGVEPDPTSGSESEDRRRDVADGAALIAGITKEVK